RSLRCASSLFPILNGIEVEVIAQGKLLLGHPEIVAQCLYVNRPSCNSDHFDAGPAQVVVERKKAMIERLGFETHLDGNFAIMEHGLDRPLRPQQRQTVA